MPWTNKIDRVHRDLTKPDAPWMFRYVLLREADDKSQAIEERSELFKERTTDANMRGIFEFATAVASKYPWARQEMLDDQVLLPD
ncbi:MAG: hypothetical protein IPH13_20755 [Planctomycetes bacterium]|nr:hypothetical protein [Planctomycetota bacterium]